MSVYNPYALGLEDTVVGVMLQIQLGTSIVPAGFSHIPELFQGVF